MWRLDDLADAAAAALESREAALRAEQAVHGLDALEEVEFHPILADGFGLAGFGALREQRFPSASPSAPSSPSAPAGGVAENCRPQGPRPGEVRTDLLGIPADSARERCDLVLTPLPGQSIADPIVTRRRSRDRKLAAAGTLFEPLVAREPDPEPPPAVNAIPPQDAFWLEIKLVGQFCFENGIPGPNRTYASQLLRGSAADLAKLAKDPLITSGALALILFTDTAATAEHDLIAVAHRCLDKSLTDSSPVTRSFAISDCIGNTLCSVALLRSRPG